MAIPAAFFMLLVLSTEIRAQAIPEQNIEDHYWKEYNGTIPEDALSAGNSSNGTPVYIGQTFFDADTLIPGQIDAVKKTLVYTMKRLPQTTVTNIKILCVRNPNHYEWINTSLTNVRLLTMNQLILGGYSDNWPFLIGRTFWDGAIAVGKIYFGHYATFGFSAGGSAVFIEDDFQVLSYNPRSSITVIRKEKKTECEGGSKVYNIYFN